MCAAILDDAMSAPGSSHRISYGWDNFWVLFDTNLALNSLPTPLSIFCFALYCFSFVFTKDKDSFFFKAASSVFCQLAYVVCIAFTPDILLLGNMP